MILATDGEPIEPHHLFAGGEQSSGGVMSLHLQGNSGGTLHAQGVAGTGAAAMQAPPAAATASARAGAGLTPAAAPVVAPLHQAEEQMLRQALQSAGGNVALAGRLLGISRATMAYRVRKFGIGGE